MLLKDPYFTQDVFSYMAVTELVEVCPRVSRLWMHAMVLHFWVKNPFGGGAAVFFSSGFLWFSFGFLLVFFWFSSWFSFCFLMVFFYASWRMPPKIRHESELSQGSFSPKL